MSLRFFKTVLLSVALLYAPVDLRAEENSPDPVQAAPAAESQNTTVPDTTPAEAFTGTPKTSEPAEDSGAAATSTTPETPQEAAPTKAEAEPMSPVAAEGTNPPVANPSVVPTDPVTPIVENKPDAPSTSPSVPAAATVSVPPVRPEWKHESEAGMTLLGGNSNSRTFTAKQETIYEAGADKVKSSGQYLYTTALGNEVARNWIFALRYERSLAERLSLYAGSGADGNRFAGREYRINTDLGVRYYIVPGDKVDAYFAQEFGMRYIFEKRTELVTPREVETPSLRFYLEGAAPLSDTLSFKMWFELLPDLMDYQRLLINTEASLKFLITRHLYLKVSFRANYVGMPVQANLARWDYVYTTALAIKY